MNRKWTDRIVAGFVFVWSLGLYLMTVAPTVSFWDPGERIASAFTLQVMHPPGAPFYLLLARIFAMLAPSQETVALAVNLLSVLASAGAVLLTHLIIVRLVRRWQPDLKEQSTGQYVIALTSGVIGAVTYSVTDSFWFNAGIAEVYALSTFFTALVVWLVLRWSEAARREEELLRGGRHPFRLNANRYLVLIAFLFGIALGVHLLSLLAFFFVALIVFFTEFDREHWTPRQRWLRIVAAGAVASALFLAIYPGLVVGLPTLFKSLGAPFLTSLILAVVIAYGVYKTHQMRRPVANLAFMCVAVLFIGYTSYALVFIRSATEPPLDINDPDTIEKFISYLEREQYGDTPLLRGVSYNDETGQVPRRDGEKTLFPRRYSPKPRHLKVYERYDSDLEFFLEYQVGYMYIRYFLWNFSGRASDVQGAPAITGLSFVDPPSTQDRFVQTPSEKESRNVYFALPLLLGLFGAFYHFSRDWRRAFSVFVLFFITGIGIVIYLNQTPMQPRERHYSYVGSFLAFSLWIGIGAGGLLQIVYESLRDAWSPSTQLASLLGTGLLVFLAVPGWMALENFGDHDRSGNYTPRDYAYNMLNSVGENGILFTNGDNDTYPLWYLQHVEGVRRDVRVVNLSLLNTKWYIRQLKSQSSYDSPPLPISLSDDRIEKLGYARWKPKKMTLPVDSSAMRHLSEYLPDSNETATLQRPMQWKMKGRRFQKDVRVLQVADYAVYNILRNIARNGWDRPFHFAVTVARSGQLNLQDYFQLEGQSYRILPIKHDQLYGRVIPGLTDQRMSQFRFTNLNNPTEYYNKWERRMVDGYRVHFSHAAERLAQKGHSQEADRLLSGFTESVPFSTIPGDLQSILFTTRAFRAIGNTEKVASLMKVAEPLIFNQLATASSQRRFRLALQYAGRMRRNYLKMGMKSEVETFDQEINDALSKASFQVPTRIRKAYGLAGDTARAPMKSLQPSPTPQPPSSNQ